MPIEEAELWYDCSHKVNIQEGKAELDEVHIPEWKRLFFDNIGPNDFTWKQRQNCYIWSKHVIGIWDKF